MPQIFCKLLASFRRIGPLVLLLTILPLMPAVASDPLPAEIPSKTLSHPELIEQSAQAVGQIVDPKERIAVIAKIFYELRDMSRDELRPLVDVLAREAQKEESRGLIAEHADGIRTVPEIILEVAMKLPDEKHRSQAHWYTVRNSAAVNPGLARQALQELKGTLRYPDALVAFSYYGPRSLDECKAVLLEIKDLGPSRHQPQISFIFASALSRFASTHLGDVVQFVLSSLPPGEATATLCQMASNCFYTRKEAEAGNKLLDAAAERIMSHRTNASEVEMLLRLGFAQRDFKRALALLDEYWLPQLEEQRNVESLAASISLLAYGSLAGTLEKAENVAERIGINPERMKVSVLLHVANGQGPDATLQWLKEEAKLPFRDATVGPLARGLEAYAGNHRLKGEVVQAWVKVLSEYALHIEDEMVRGKACDEIHNLAEWYEATSPAAIEAERAKFYAAAEQSLSPFERLMHIDLLSQPAQRAEIDRVWQEREKDSNETVVAAIRSSATLIRDSSLPLEEKRNRMRTLLEEARKIPNVKERASALSGLGMGLSAIDHAQSLAVLREELSLAREFGLKPEYHDVGDSLGTVFPLVTADECLSFNPARFRGDLNEVAKSRWAIARELQDTGDRDVVLASLAAVLAHQQNYAAATGLALLLDSPARKAKALSKIAGLQSGKLRED